MLNPWNDFRSASVRNAQDIRNLGAYRREGEPWSHSVAAVAIVGALIALAVWLV